MCLAIPGRLLDVTGADPLLRCGRVDFGGVVKVVDLSCVPEVTVGQYVLVHVGMALTVVDEEEARRVFETLRDLDDLSELDPGEVDSGTEATRHEKRTERAP